MREARGATAELKDLLGHWYMIATTHGYFESRPRVLSSELLMRSLGGGRLRCNGEVGTPRGFLHFRSDVAAPRSSGRFGWMGAGGLSLLARRNWHLVRSDDSTVVSAFHDGSMITKGGVALLARADVPEEHIRATIETQYCDLGLFARERTDLAWRGRPPGMDADGSSAFATRIMNGDDDRLSRVFSLRRA